MIADQLVTNVSQLVSPAGSGARRGRQMRELTMIRDAALAISDGRVVWCGARRDWAGSARSEIDAAGCAVVPGLIDPHTHIVWGGDRLADFELRTSGIAYETILASGGGIRHTVAETTRAAAATLLADATQRARQMMRAGATTIEVKSGYGLSWPLECRVLDVIGALANGVAARISPTMLFHLPPRDPGERQEFVRDAVTQWIPELAQRRIATAIDVFVEREAFTLDEADHLMRAARHAGLQCKAHADQFTAMGAVELAIGHGALSVDHLEASGDAQIAALAGSETIGVILPGVTLHLGLAAAPARRLIDAGAAIAIGTDCNPGSSPLFSASLALALAVRLNALTPAEALTAATANAAAAIGRTDVGRVASGMHADFLILHSADWRDLPYTLGGDPVARVFIAGSEIHY